MHSNGLKICGLLVMVSFLGFSGCAAYKPITRPVPKLSVLSPELSERNIEKLLKAEVKPQFPAVLAVAKVTSPFADDVYAGGQDEDKYALEFPHTEEMAGWESLKSLRGVNYKTLISRVKIINPSLLSGNPTLRKLRDAAALLNAPLLLVYVQKDNASDGFNFPGYTVAYYSVCQAVLVDTRSGIILATATSEAKREEKVTLFGRDATKQKLQKQCPSEAVAGLQKNFAKALVELEK